MRGVVRRGRVGPEDVIVLVGVGLIGWSAWRLWSPEVAALVCGGVLVTMAILAATARAGLWTR